MCKENKNKDFIQQFLSSCHSPLRIHKSNMIHACGAGLAGLQSHEGE